MPKIEFSIKGDVTVLKQSGDDVEVMGVGNVIVEGNPSYLISAIKQQMLTEPVIRDIIIQAIFGCCRQMPGVALAALDKISEIVSEQMPFK